QPATTVTFPATPGAYVLRLVVGDSDLNGSATMTVFVATPCINAPAGITDWFKGEGNVLNTRGTADATANSSLGYAPGKVGQAMDFNGSGYAELPVMNLGPAFSIEFWMKPRDASQDGQSLVSNQRGAASTYGALYWDSGSSLSFYTNNIPRVITPGGTVPLNQWSHVVLTHDGSVTRIYINGKLQGIST